MLTRNLETVLQLFCSESCISLVAWNELDPNSYQWNENFIFLWLHYCNAKKTLNVKFIIACIYFSYTISTKTIESILFFHYYKTFRWSTLRYNAWKKKSVVQEHFFNAMYTHRCNMETLFLERTYIVFRDCILFFAFRICI